MNKKFLLVLILVLPILVSGCARGGAEVTLEMNLDKSEIFPGEPLQVNWTVRNEGNRPVSDIVLLGYRKGEETNIFSIRQTPVTVKPGKSISRKVEWEKTSRLQPGNYHIHLALRKLSEEDEKTLKEIESEERSFRVEEGEPKIQLELENLNLTRSGELWEIDRLNISYKNRGKAPLTNPTFDFTFLRNGDVLFGQKNMKLLTNSIQPGERGFGTETFGVPVPQGNISLKIKVREEGEKTIYGSMNKTVSIGETEEEKKGEKDLSMDVKGFSFNKFFQRTSLIDVVLGIKNTGEVSFTPVFDLTLLSEGSNVSEGNNKYLNGLYSHEELEPGEEFYSSVDLFSDEDISEGDYRVRVEARPYGEKEVLETKTVPVDLNRNTPPETSFNSSLDIEIEKVPVEDGEIIKDILITVKNLGSKEVDPTFDLVLSQLGEAVFRDIGRSAKGLASLKPGEEKYTSIVFRKYMEREVRSTVFVEAREEGKEEVLARDYKIIQLD